MEPPLPPGDPQTEDQHLLAFVRDRDINCPLCGYNLRALTVPRCPECGQTLKLTVGLAEPFLKAWIACAAATCLSAGVGFLILYLLTKAGPAPPFRSALEAISFYAFPAMIPIAGLFLFYRRAFLRRSRNSQTIIALVTLVFVALQFGIFFSWIR